MIACFLTFKKTQISINQYTHLLFHVFFSFFHLHFHFLLFDYLIEKAIIVLIHELRE